MSSRETPRYILYPSLGTCPVSPLASATTSHSPKIHYDDSNLRSGSSPRDPFRKKVIVPDDPQCKSAHSPLGMTGTCVECVTECAEPSCVEVSQSGCTSQCVDIVHVVPCPYPNHSQGQAAPCYIDCEGIPDCSACGPEKFIPAPCPEPHPCLSETFGSCNSGKHGASAAAAAALDVSFESWFCSTCLPTNERQSNAATASLTQKDSYPEASISDQHWSNMSNALNNALYHDVLMSSMAAPMPVAIEEPSQRPFKDDPPREDTQQPDSHSSPHMSSQQPSPSITHSSPTSQSPLTCMWGDCLATFQNLSELVGHVNLEHLRLPSNPILSTTRTQDNGSMSQYPFYQQPSITQLQSSPVPPGHDPNNMFCLWRNCHVYPTPNAVPGPSSGNQADTLIETLAAHLFHDHLGLTGFNSLSNPPTADSSSQNIWESNPPTFDSRSSSDNDNATPPSPNPSIQRESASSPEVDDHHSGDHDCSIEVHRCMWDSCGKMFDSCSDLTTHLTSSHVGGGKGHYECRWEGCDRHGERSFTSKQKICRHLQTHTGHRPFQCQICNERFSEAATLQQHMRRHTNEKPFKCTHPGCSKSFSIRGALTIHLRTHSGNKPFKCSYCNRAFSESSNLSKHLRTHTGARPYPCSHAGCGKAFARPDQLARHMGTHNKT